MQLFGGRDPFAKKLEQLFTEQPGVSNESVADMTGFIGQYVHGNEPSHHIAYLYTWAGQPWKTQEWAREIMDRLYTLNPDGLCGNDDCGQMSAWYVFTAMGFYPFCPGMPFYTIGSPIFEKVVIHLDNGKDLMIEARNVSKENKYIQSAILNGQTWNKPWFNHSDIIHGGHIIFEMGPEPNKEWGASEDAMPPSMGKMS
jgi:predicted alpha-1,2-mannosidase